MKEIIIKVEQFLKMEYEINISNYVIENKNDWEKLAGIFREKFLMENMNEYWFKIPVEHFSPDRKKELQARITQRKLYLIKLVKEKNLVNVFSSLADRSDDLRNCLVFKIENDGIKLVGIGNVCENCFSAGYIEEITGRCSNCSGTGFNYSDTSGLISWRTIFIEPGDQVDYKLFNQPSSALQKKMVSMQLE